MNKNGDYFPLFGICLGFELLTYVTANRVEHRTHCNSMNQQLPLEFTRGLLSLHIFNNNFFSMKKNIFLYIFQVFGIVECLAILHLML